MVVGSVSRGCQVVVIGGGPGGYVAAIRLGQMGKDVILVERAPRLGGICLNEGCIPSKALIHAADLVHEVKHASNMGISVREVGLDMVKLGAWKNSIVERLTGGVSFLCEKAGVEVLRGEARFLSDRSLAVESDEGMLELEFEQAVIATGSSPMPLPGFDVDGDLVIGPREALDLNSVPERLVVIGAGYIGLELGTVFSKLGAEVSVVEFLPSIFPNMEPEVGKTMKRSLKKLGMKVHLGHRANGIDREGDQAFLVAVKDEKELRLPADKVLLSVGRVPNSSALGLESIGVEMDEKGFIRTDEKMQTSCSGIYAIGDVVGGALLAHKAYQEAKVAAGVICGEKAAFDNLGIPAVVYTDPEIATVGITEAEAREAGYEVSTGSFSLKASGRAMTLDATDGFIKTVFDAGNENRLLGLTAMGRGVSELIGEATLALEMSAFAEDIALTIHPHPSLSEALQEAVEAALGKAVHQAK